MTNRNIAFAGAAVLLVGLFMPIVSMPMAGSINLFSSYGSVIALAIVAMAALGAGLAATDRTTDVVWPGLSSAGLLIYSFGRLLYGMAQARDLLKQLDGNPFASIARSAAGASQVQWGWLVLGAGAALLVFAGVKSRNAESSGVLALGDSKSKGVAALALIALVGGPTGELVEKLNSGPQNTASSLVSSSAPTSPTVTGTSVSSKEEAAYIVQNLSVYDLHAKYYEGYDGKHPGVEFKLKNNGNRTLDEVTVRIVFYDAGGKAIGEEEYHPVLVTELGFGDNTPLRPNYIWQQERGKFYKADKVPSEWEVGKVTATITQIKFAPPEPTVQSPAG